MWKVALNVDNNLSHAYGRLFRGHSKDATVTFIFTVYHEVEQARWCLGCLRASYPHSRVIMISDGDADPRYGHIGREYGVEYVLGDRLKIPSKGPLYWKRFFDEYAKKPTDYLLKMDPDTHIHRPVRYFPDADYFGTLLEKKLVFEHIQGGCQGFSRRACDRILGSGVLTDQHYYAPKDWCKSIELCRNIEEYAARSGVLNVDFMIHQMMKRNGYKPVHWGETHCQWKGMVRNETKKYAITHPSKVEGGL